MSSKSAEGPDLFPRPRRAWSLAARLTAWYTGSAFALILAVTGFLYWALTRSLDREDDQHLADKVRIIQTVLKERPGDTAALREEAEEGWEASRHAQIDVRIVYVRILGEDGRGPGRNAGHGQGIASHVVSAAHFRAGCGKQSVFP